MFGHIKLDTLLPSVALPFIHELSFLAKAEKLFYKSIKKGNKNFKNCFINQLVIKKKWWDCNVAHPGVKKIETWSEVFAFFRSRKAGKNLLHAFCDPFQYNINAYNKVDLQIDTEKNTIRAQEV